MRVAIIGAGFVGLALSYFLKKQDPSLQIDIIDRYGIGKGASGIAAGLLHPFVGLHAKLNPFGLEGMEATLELLNEVNAFTGTEVFSRTGLWRVAQDLGQLEDYKRLFESQKEMVWKDAVEMKELGLDCLGAVWIPNAYVVDSEKYLQGLWQLLESQGVRVIIRNIEEIDALKDYKYVFITAGAWANKIRGLEMLPLTPIKGQVMKLKPKEASSFSSPISSKTYLIPKGDGWIAGATYERNYQTEEVNLEALKDLQVKTHHLLPFLKEAFLVDCRASLRGSTKDHLPKILNVKPDLWAIFGMGSRGLLYHAKWAKDCVLLWNGSKS